MASVAMGAALGAATGGYSVGAAAVDAASGAVCAGALAKLGKAAKLVASAGDDIARGARTLTLNYARRKAVAQAWKQEAAMVRQRGVGSRAWSAAEKEELLAAGKVKGYEGHHINSVKGSPSSAADPDNIEFVRKGAEHLEKHGGDYRNATTGERVIRE